MNRIDLGYQARWEMLKVLTKQALVKCGDSDMREAFETFLTMMDMLEKTEKPCLSRAIETHISPLTGEPRDVFEPLPDPKKELNK